MSFQIKKLINCFKVSLFEASASEIIRHSGQIWFGFAGYNHRYSCSSVGLALPSAALWKILLLLNVLHLMLCKEDVFFVLFYMCFSIFEDNQDWGSLGLN